MGVGTYHSRSGGVGSGRGRSGDKVHKTMHEYKMGTLHSGSKKGPKVQSRKQAIAIALSQQRKERGRRTKRSARRR